MHHASHEDLMRDDREYRQMATARNFVSTTKTTPMKPFTISDHVPDWLLFSFLFVVMVIAWAIGARSLNRDLEETIEEDRW